jgi:hypothetical protein
MAVFTGITPTLLDSTGVRRRSATGEPCAFIEEIAAQRMRLEIRTVLERGHVSHL